jgi:hypothetical protein
MRRVIAVSLSQTAAWFSLSSGRMTCMMRSPAAAGRVRRSSTRAQCRHNNAWASAAATLVLT